MTAYAITSRPGTPDHRALVNLTTGDRFEFTAEDGALIADMLTSEFPECELCEDRSCIACPDCGRAGCEDCNTNCYCDDCTCETCCDRTEDCTCPPAATTET